MLGLASKSIHLNFALTRGGLVVTCCCRCRCNNYKFILLLAVLEAFIAISDNLTFYNQYCLNSSLNLAAESTLSEISRGSVLF